MTIEEKDKIPVGGFLDPTNPEKVLGSSASILDEETGMRQSEINTDTDNKLSEHDKRIEQLSNSHQVMSDAEYEALLDKDPAKIYLIYEE